MTAEAKAFNDAGLLKAPEDSGGATETETGRQLKRNSAAFITDIVPSSRYESSQIISLTRRIFSEETKQVLMGLSDWFFNHAIWNTNRDSLLISYYGNGGAYEPHCDNTLLTTVTWLWENPKRFTGGNFVFPAHGIEIEVKRGRTVMFPSPVYHSVLPVKLLSDERSAGRFTITQFADIQ